MDAEASAPRLRIVVAFNACRRDLGTLELAAALAARRGGEIEAVFVEELNLMNSAELTFVKEIDRVLGTERLIDPLRISRAQRIGLSHIRRELGRLAEELQVHGSVTTLRGHLVPTLLAYVRQIDLLVFGRREQPLHDHAREQRTGSTHGTTPPWSTRQEPVWAFFDGSDGALAAVAAAADLAAWERRGLWIAAHRGPSGARPQWQNDLTRSQDPFPPNARVIEIDRFDAPQLWRRLRQTGCRMLVLPRASSDLIEAAAETAEWPLLLV